ncbi:MAG: hypothetical protein U9N85_07055, partial [Bacteroidota bacterium]|nr:hypothetical protein [Bacteroidota bacterium]
MKYIYTFNSKYTLIALIVSLLFVLSPFTLKAQDHSLKKISVQAKQSDNITRRPPTRTGIIPEIKTSQGGKLLHNNRGPKPEREITVSQKPGTKRSPDKVNLPHERLAKDLKTYRRNNPNRTNKLKRKGDSKDDSPIFFEVFVTNGSDIDGDGYWDLWDFEIDVDPYDGTIAYDVWISIYDNYGNEWIDIGPFDFVGNSSADNIVITNFDATQWGFTTETDVSFTFYADNTLGSDVYYLDTPVDLPMDRPVFYDVSIVNTLDEDNNGYYELWDFDIDVDAYYEDIADNVYIEIWDDEGNSWGPYGPYDFSGATSNDNVLIQNFGNDFYNFNFVENVNFTFLAYNAYGEDQMNINTPVDKLWDIPSFYDVYIVNESDMDGDGYFDAWDFEVDVDALYNFTAKDVYIEINDDEGNSRGPFGPYDFSGQTGNDNLSITDFSYNTYGLNNPENVQFTFTAYNDYGTDQMTTDVPVDTYFEAPVFYEAFTINTIDQDNDNYLEQWDFELDIDAPYTGIAENIYIDISDNEGNDWGTYGPYTFEGETSDDNISISSW